VSSVQQPGNAVGQPATGVFDQGARFSGPTGSASIPVSVWYSSMYVIVIIQIINQSIFKLISNSYTDELSGNNYIKG